MAAPNFFVKSLLRVALENTSAPGATPVTDGRAVLVAIITGQFTSNIDKGNGLRVVSASVNGKTVSFGSDPSLSISDLIAYAEEAVETWDTWGGAAGVQALLSRPLVTRARASFGC